MKKNRQYDEYYSNGKFDIGKIGNDILVRNHYTEQEFENRNKEIASHYDEVKADIDSLVEKIVAGIKKCNPLMLMQVATDLSMSQLLHVVSEIQMDEESSNNLRLIEYVQSILVSVTPEKIELDEAAQKVIMHEVFKNIQDLYIKCQWFHLVWAAKAQESGEYSRKDIEYIIEAQLMSNVRGNRYQYLQLDDIEKLMSPHSDKMMEIYKVSATEFIEGLKKLEYSLSSAKLDAFKGFINRYKEFLKESKGKSIEELEQLMNQIQDSENTSAFLSECFGIELYNVKKVTGWSDELIDGLSLGLGENNNLFTKSEFPGWPIQNLPVQKRPFITIMGTSYCFDYYNLFDNIYRIIQKSVREHDEKYVTKWSDIQKQASESLVAEKFSKIMPNAEVYIGNYYSVGESLKQMDENDILIICDDIIIIAEVKAGSFTYTPAITDFTAHKKSFEALIRNADYQCVRTLDYINRNDRMVSFYTCNKSKKFELNRLKVRKIYTICITVDNFNVFQAKIEKTNFFKLASGTIAMSLDDLDVYEKYFDSELCFLHYLKHRQAATRIRNLMFNDELDHLGMYISQNIYENCANDYKECTSFVATGFREDIDAYFAGLYNKDLVVDKPKQNIPEYVKEIIAFLEYNKIAGRAKFAEFLLDMSYDTREQFHEAIVNRRLRERELGRITPVWVEGDFAYCEYIMIPGIEQIPDQLRRKYVYANMLDRKYDRCWYINIDLDNQGRIVNVLSEELEYDRHKDDGLSEQEISTYLLDIKERRRQHGTSLPAAHKKKIYPNDLCPCGSGMKYKKCCGNPSKK